MYNALAREGTSFREEAAFWLFERMGGEANKSGWCVNLYGGQVNDGSLCLEVVTIEAIQAWDWLNQYN
jgi:hypothetical protein